MKSGHLSLMTDFYELTMMQGYFYNAPEERGVYEMFYRSRPFNGGYAVFAGLYPFLEALQDISFSAEDIKYLESPGIFKTEFLDYLKGFRFSGDIYALKEGTFVFPDEPLVRVHGTLMEIQFIESMLLNFTNYQTLIATKASRITGAAGEAPVLEFGLRRAQGTDGALSASRAAYIGGAASTSNTLAGKLYSIPVSGTMAHSWIMGFESELESFERYADLYPDNCVLLVDTYDTLNSGVPNAIKVFRRIQETASSMAIRIDSGDLEYLSKNSRIMLDREGLNRVRIYASGDIDEWIIEHLRNSGAPVDAWGVGTRMVTGWDDPALSGVYKIVAVIKGDKIFPRIKISNQPEKITNPGIKNIMRFYDTNGHMTADLLYLEDEEAGLMKKISEREPVNFNHPSVDFAGFTMTNYSSAEKLLHRVMSNGRINGPVPALAGMREHRNNQKKMLDATFRRLLNPHRYKVSLSDKMKELKFGLIKTHS